MSASEPGVSAIVVAGGRGVRLGAVVPKAFVPLRGESLLARSAGRLAAAPSVDEVVLVLPADALAGPEVDRARAAIEAGGARAVVVAGGARRQDSVRAGIGASAAGAGRLVAVHDAARPFVRPDDVERLIARARQDGGALLATPARDTVKRVGAGDLVEQTLDRRELWLAQTPQVFGRDALAAAIDAAGAREVTDCAAAMEGVGVRPALVAASGPNPKVTTPEDVPLAEALAAVIDGQEAGSMRIRTGLGTDIHPLVPDRPFMLGGVRLEHPTGPKGHSDGDVLCHAIADALLGAAGLGDIGEMFPDTDPSIEGIPGAELLGKTAARVRAAGWRIVNVDATVHLERPKVGPHKEQIRARLAQALGIAAGALNVKAKRGEGLDAVGRGEAVAASVVVTVVGG